MPGKLPTAMATLILTSTVVLATPDYKVRTFKNDPMNVHEYRLSNGLRVVIAPHPVSPRIIARIIVHAGSRHEEETATGLAHYLEHIMFKGTDEIGTVNWNEEKKYIDQLAELYEQLRNATSDQDRNRIFKQIDSLSAVAAKYAIPGEYARLYGLLGGRNLNAYTTWDVTVYLGDIPANEFERWLELESERFSMVVPRLFHTELETVYEEYNMRFQDEDYYRVMDAIFNKLFEGHPYARPIIGYPEHLKYPSIKATYRFFNNYYVPNNMTICISGDIKPEQITLIDRYFGKLKPNPDKPPVEHDTLFVAPFIKKVETEVISTQPDYLAIAFRVPTKRMKDLYPVMMVTDYIIQNGFAGILDLDLIQKQKVLNVYTSYWSLREGGVYIIVAYPREGQSLEEVYSLVMNSISKLWKGEFPDWMVSAAVRNIRLDLMERMESPAGRVGLLTEVYSDGIDWGDFLQIMQNLKKVSKKDVVDLASKYFASGHVVVWKRQGSPEHLLIPKPEFSKIEASENATSEFARKLLSKPAPLPEPRFVDFNSDLQYGEVQAANKPVEVWYAHNPYSDIFRLELRFPYGYVNNPLWEVAFRLLEYCGTSKTPPEEFKKQLFRLGIDLSVDVRAEDASIRITALQEVYDKALKLLKELLTDPVADQQVLSNVISDILKERDNMRKEPVTLIRAMIHYVVYGSKNRYTLKLKKEELQQLKVDKVLAEIQRLLSTPHTVLLSAPEPLEKLLKPLQSFYATVQIKDPVIKYKLNERETLPDSVFFVHYDKVQVDVLRVSLLSRFDKDILPYIYLFNEYYGAGLNSITFQEIREKRALAYSAYSYIFTPRLPERRFILFTYTGGQYDKLNAILDVYENVLFVRPIQDIYSFNSSKLSIKKSIATRRYWGIRLLNYVYANKKLLNLDEDPSRIVYNAVDDITWDDFERFFRNYITSADYAYIISGKKDLISIDQLSKLKPVKELSPADILPE